MEPQPFLATDHELVVPKAVCTDGPAMVSCVFGHIHLAYENR